MFLSRSSAEARHLKRVKTVSILDSIRPSAPLPAPLPGQIITRLEEKCSRGEKESSDPVMRAQPSGPELAGRTSGRVRREIMTSKTREDRAGRTPVSQAVLSLGLEGLEGLEGGEGEGVARPGLLETKEGERNSSSRPVSPVSLRRAGWRRRIPISTTARRHRGPERRLLTPGARWRTSSRRATAGWRESSAPASSRTPSIPPTGLEAVKSNASIN